VLIVFERLTDLWEALSPVCIIGNAWSWPLSAKDVSRKHVAVSVTMMESELISLCYWRQRRYWDPLLGMYAHYELWWCLASTAEVLWEHKLSVLIR
jgi:hypothetical protein